MGASEVLAYPAFVRLWIADTVSALGTFISALALQFLMIETMNADQAALGVVRAAQWLPSLTLGLLAGVRWSPSPRTSRSYRAWFPSRCSRSRTRESCRP